MNPHKLPPISLQGQEEALGLSGQLSDARQQVASLAAALEQARTHLEAQQTALAQVHRVMHICEPGPTARHAG